MAKIRAGDGTEIYYEAWGRGEPLLLVPGLGGDVRMWACQRLPLGRRYRCIAVDNRGSGHSGKPPGPYSLFEMAADAATVLDAEGVASAHVLGYSMGSYPAQILAVAQPERVRSLLLVASSSRHHHWRRELLADWSEVARARGMHVMARRAVPYLLGRRTARRFGLWINLLWPLILSQPADAFAAQVDALLDFSDEYRVFLAHITAPTLVLVGAEDRLTPPGDAEELIALVPGARLHVVRGAGHVLMVEAAPDFNIAVLDFLAGVTAGVKTR